MEALLEAAVAMEVPAAMEETAPEESPLPLD